MIDWKSYIQPLLSGEKLVEALFELPSYCNSISESDEVTRLLALADIYKIYVPSAMAVEIYHKLYMAMLISLQKKDTKEALLQQKENFLSRGVGSYRGIVGGSDSFTIIGKSGIGKSSAIERAVSLITEGQVIHIESPRIIVIPILQVQCPYDSSSKALLLSVLKAVDDRIGSNYYKSGIRTGVTTDTLIGLVSQVCLNHVGLLIIDEIQNVVKSKKGGLLIGMMMQLINCSGISVAMVGTPESSVFFESEMQLARRSIGLNYDALNYDEHFIVLCQILFGYQYTKQKTELTDEIINWLYEHTQGVVALLISLVHDAQELAIINGREVLDITSLSLVYEERMGMLHGRISSAKKRKSQTSKTVSKKMMNVSCKSDIVPDDIESLVDIVAFCKKNDLDVIKELSQKITLEVVRL